MSEGRGWRCRGLAVCDRNCHSAVSGVVALGIRSLSRRAAKCLRSDLSQADRDAKMTAIQYLALILRLCLGWFRGLVKLEAAVQSTSAVDHTTSTAWVDGA